MAPTLERLRGQQPGELGELRPRLLEGPTGVTTSLAVSQSEAVRADGEPPRAGATQEQGAAVEGDPTQPPEPAEVPAPPAEGIRQHRFVPPPGATVVLLVRHGESMPEHPDRPFPTVDGHGDPDLAEEGHRQARAVGERLAAEHRNGSPIHAVYVTTLRRTQQTAAPLVEAIGLEPQVVPELREVHLGEWEGEFRARVRSADPIFARVLTEERWDLIPGAEPLEDFAARLREGIDLIAGSHADQRVVAVVHGGVIGQLLSMATGASGFAFTTADNGSISELVVMPDGSWRVRRFNDTAHL